MINFGSFDESIDDNNKGNNANQFIFNGMKFKLQDMC